MSKTNNSGVANENVIRIIAFYVVILISTAYVLNNYWISFFLAIDFILRSFFDGKGSLLKVLAVKTAVLFKVPNKPIYAAPKKFAAALGAIFSLIIGIAQLTSLLTIANTAIVLFLVCAILESVFGVCVGCYVYSFFSTIGSRLKWN